MTIQEAAEKYTVSLDTQDVYIKFVTHYESLMRAAGYEWVKVEGDYIEVAEQIRREFLQTQGGFLDMIQKSIAIGREQGKKEMANLLEFKQTGMLVASPPKTEPK